MQLVSPRGGPSCPVTGGPGGTPRLPQLGKRTLHRGRAWPRWCWLPHAPVPVPLLSVSVFTICPLFPPLKAFGAGLPASRMPCNTAGASYHRGAGAELACQCCPTHASLLARWRRRRTWPRHPASGPAGREASSSPDAAPGGEEVFRYCGVFRRFLRCSAIPRGRTGGVRHCRGSPVRLLGAGSSLQPPGTGCLVRTCTLHGGRRSHRLSRCGRGLRPPWGSACGPGVLALPGVGLPVARRGWGGCSPPAREHDGAGYAVPAPPCHTPLAPPSAPLPATPPAEQGWR